MWCFTAVFPAPVRHADPAGTWPGAHEVAVLAVGVELLGGDLCEVAETEPVDEWEINLQDRSDHPAGERLGPRQIHGSAVLHQEVSGPVPERRERTSLDIPVEPAPARPDSRR
ncbi:hypothetical protein GCM10010129_76530 [Streptomyces fumigatiscleroticus]|nr:hypothetical protein GCM10010129_76530 [Streptomyces fumigatiscleroticus]